MTEDQAIKAAREHAARTANLFLIALAAAQHIWCEANTQLGLELPDAQYQAITSSIVIQMQRDGLHDAMPLATVELRAKARTEKPTAKEDEAEVETEAETEAAPNDKEKRARDLWNEILECTENDEAAKALLREITAKKGGGEGRGFAGFDDPRKLKHGWQIDKATEKLHAHPAYAEPVPAHDPEDDDGGDL